MKKIYILILAIAGCYSSFAQTIFYDIPIGQTIGLDQTSGDICSAPWTTEEAKQSSIGNSWGGTWTSTNGGTPSSVVIEVMFTVGDVTATYPTQLNSIANNTVNSGASVNCASGMLLSWSLDPTNYVSMGSNTFLVDYSTSTIINQLDNLPYANDPYLRVTVTYTGAGISEQTGKEITLEKITDMTGRETKYRTNTPLMYWYSNGTVKRIFILE